MQPIISNLIELTVEKGVSIALAKDHDGLSDEERLAFYTKCVMDSLQTGFTFLDIDEELEDEDDYE